MHRHAAGVIAPVFEPLQALNQHGNDVAGRDSADDATHGEGSLNEECGNRRRTEKKFQIIFFFLLNYLSINSSA
jgi:hypothetical protein